jgi:hypothetical protein
MTNGIGDNLNNLNDNPNNAGGQKGPVNQPVQNNVQRNVNGFSNSSGRTNSNVNGNGQGIGRKRFVKNNNNNPNPGANPQQRGQLNNKSNLVTENLSVGLIPSKYKNFSLISSNYLTLTDQVLEFSFTIKPIKERLDAQASVWARKHVSIQETYLKKVLGAHTNQWEKLLSQAYIYSYYSAILYALSSSRVAEFDTNRTFVTGHGILYQCLLKPYHTFKCMDFHISYKLTCTEMELNEIIAQAEEYDFIKKYLVKTPRFYLENQSLERILNGLSSEVPSFGPKMIKISNSNVLDTYLTKDNFPLINSFYTKTSKTDKWFYSFCNDKSILDSSTLFGKACFVTCVDEDDKYSKYFDLVSEEDNFYLTKYELQHIAGSSYPQYIDHSAK